MKSLLRIAVPFLFVLLASGCTPKGSPIASLGTPRLVPQSPPDSIQDNGIGQDPATGGIFVQWYAAGNARGYKLYRSDSVDSKGSPTGFEIVADLMSSSSLNDTSYVDPNTGPTGTRYYYYVRAYAADGSMSGPSDTTYFALLPRPSQISPVQSQEVPIDSVVFQWHDNTNGGAAVVKVRDISVTPISYVWVSRRDYYYQNNPSLKFNSDGAATGQLTVGHSYQWRIDRFDLDGNGRAFEGARSPWVTFSVR